MLIVLELTRGLSFKIRRPSALSNIKSLKRGKLEPAVVSAKAAIMSLTTEELIQPAYSPPIKDQIPHLLCEDQLRTLPLIQQPETRSRTSLLGYDLRMLVY